MSAIRARIEGRVQGVGFRAWAAKLAEGLGLAGRVQNAPDGSVTAFAQGPAEALEAFRARLAEGPPAARVTRVAVEPATPEPGLTGFRITR